MSDSNLKMSPRVVRRFASNPQTGQDVSAKMGLLNYIEVLYSRYSAEGKGIAKSYKSVGHSLRGFLDYRRIRLDEVDDRFIMDYSKYLEGRVVASTVSFYMRTLRSVLNNARSEGLIDVDFNWSANVNIAVKNTKKETADKGLPKDTLRKIATLDLSGAPNLEFVRDMFMFSFYAHGIELSDLANLRKTNLTGSRLTYSRRGIGKNVEIHVGGKILAIVKRYKESGNPYLLPILQRGGRKYQFSSINATFYRSMREIGRLLDPELKLSFRLSRDSWLTMIRQINIAEVLI